MSKRTTIGVLSAIFAAAVLTTGASASISNRAGATHNVCNPCGVGQVLSWYGTTYRVSRVRVANRIGDGFVGGRADGVFVIVTLTLTDTKSRPSTILADAVRVKTARGDSYTVSDKAFAVYSNGFDLLENLEPRLPKTVIAVYDLPRGATRGARLEIDDLSSGKKGYIRLGL